MYTRAHTHTHLSVCPSVRLSIYLSVSLSICTYVQYKYVYYVCFYRHTYFLLAHSGLLCWGAHRFTGLLRVRMSFCTVWVLYGPYVPRPPIVPLSRVSWPLLRGIQGLFEGSWVGLLRPYMNFVSALRWQVAVLVDTYYPGPDSRAQSAPQVPHQPHLCRQAPMDWSCMEQESAVP